MNSEDINKMWLQSQDDAEGMRLGFTTQQHYFAALVAAAERNKVAQWMIDHSYATGHGDTTEDLLEELDWQITESWSKVVMASVEAEREACAKVAFNAKTYIEAAEAIRARGQDAP
jgi:hypothetical protein